MNIRNILVHTHTQTNFRDKIHVDQSWIGLDCTQDVFLTLEQKLMSS